MGNPLQPSASNPTHGDLQESGHLLSRRVWLVPVTWLKAESPPHIHTDASTHTSVIFLPRLWLIEERSMQVSAWTQNLKTSHLCFLITLSALFHWDGWRISVPDGGSVDLRSCGRREAEEERRWRYSHLYFSPFSHNSPSLCFIQIHTLRIGPTCVSLIFPLLLLKGIQKVLFFWTLKEDAVQPVFRDCIENVLNTLQYNGQFQDLSRWLPWTHTHHVRFVCIVHFVGSLTWFWFFFLDNCSDGSLSVSVE